MKRIAFLIALAVPSVASAQTVPASNSYGVGAAMKCGEWTAAFRARDATEVVALTSWIGGYLSGATEVAASMPHGISLRTNMDSAFGYVDKYCADHPSESVGNATAEFLNELVQQANRPAK